MMVRMCLSAESVAAAAPTIATQSLSKPGYRRPNLVASGQGSTPTRVVPGRLRRRLLGRHPRPADPAGELGLSGGLTMG